MKPVRALLLYLALVLVGAAALAPWVWHGAQALAEHSPRFAGLARQPFHRYVNRCLLILAVAGLWPLVRALGLRSWREIGLDCSGREARRFGPGFLTGWISLGLAATAVVLGGARTWNAAAPASDWFRHFANATGAALAVGFLEELLFRGAIFTAVRRSGSFAAAALTSSLLYGFVHFFQRPEPPAQVDALTGFVTLGRMLRGFTDLSTLVPGLLSLTLAGAILAYARERSGRLWFSIGLHAGWIFWLKSFAFATRPAASAHPALWGTEKLYDGWFALAILGITGLVSAAWLRHARPPSR